MTVGGLINGSQQTTSLRRKTRVVVIGSGAGGANVGLRLAELGIDVTIVELGRKVTPADFSQEDALATALLWREFGQRVAMGDATFPVPGANALGGSTVINAGICFRTPDKISQPWIERYGADWATPERITAAQDWVWETMQVHPVRPETMGASNLTTLDAYRTMGWHGEIFDRNTPGCAGCGVCYYGCPVGGKRSVDTAQIPTAIELGATVITNARVDRITTDRGRATGITGVLTDDRLRDTPHTFEILADAVVCCAGAIDTPILLQESGIGGIDDGIGANLHLHPGFGTIGYFPDRRLEIWRGATQGAYSLEFFDDGYIMESSNLPAAAFYLLGSRVSEDPGKWMAMFPHVSVSGGMLRDTGIGTVRASIKGRSDIRFQFGQRDLAAGLRSIRRMGEAYLTAGAAAVIPNIPGATPVGTVRELERVLSGIDRPDQVNHYASHPQGTVRFAESADEGPLHPHFNLHKVPNIFVADASVFPEAVGVNPQITVMSVARIAGEYIAEAVA